MEIQSFCFSGRKGSIKMHEKRENYFSEQIASFWFS